MPTQLPAVHVHRDVDHNFLPDFAWAAGGGGVVLAVCALIGALSVTWGGALSSSAMSGGSVAAIRTYSPELAALFMAGFLVVLVARSVSARDR